MRKHPPLPMERKKNMGKKNTPPKFSVSISNFLNMISQAKADYEWNTDEISRLEHLTQDYLHMLELGDLDYGGRAKIATKLTTCRQERRASKDTVEILEPLISFLDSENGRKMVNLMKEALGKTRKTEERMDRKIYRFRVLELDDIQHKG